MNLPFKMIIETEMEKYRAETFYTKEPETIEWIKSFKPNGVFFDVGANVGVYSLYAASLYPNMRVFAFEPMRQNFDRLITNIELNGFKNIVPFPVAVGYEEKLVRFYIKNEEIGSSGSQTEKPVDEDGVEYEPTSEHTVAQWTLPLLWELSPNVDLRYLKIDVDGHEWPILEKIWGFQCESILVEVNKNCTPLEDLMEFLQTAGYERNTYFDNLPDHSSKRRGGNPENIVFRRKT